MKKNMYKKDDNFKKYQVGSIVKGTVTGIEKYGAFVNVDDNYVGLIHISEISNDFVSDINNIIKVGETIYMEIIGIDYETNHLKLSIKNINYKLNNDGIVKESRLGFLPLKNNLDKWISKRIKEIEEESNK